jgi:anti-anti-sigma factor
MAITQELSGVTTSLAPGRTTIAVSGELDRHTVRDLRDAGAAAAGPEMDLIIDLAEVSFISAAGLEALASLAKIARQGDGEFHVQRPPPRMRHLLEVAGLIQALPATVTEP